MCELLRVSLEYDSSEGLTSSLETFIPSQRLIRVFLVDFADILIPEIDRYYVFELRIDSFENFFNSVSVSLRPLYLLLLLSLLNKCSCT